MLLIIGHKNSGKDYAAKYLASHYDMKFESSSHAALRIFLLERLRDYYGYSVDSIEEAMELKNQFQGVRDVMHYEISAYNTPDKARLACDIMKENDIYVGMRCSKELAAARALGLFKLVIWIDGKEEEPETSNNLSPKHADLRIKNSFDSEFHDLLDHIGGLLTNKHVYR